MSFLRDLILQEQLQKQGYAVVPFLEKNEVDEIAAFYKSNLPEQQNAFHTTHFFTDREYKRAVNNFLIAKTRRAFDKNLVEGHFGVFANFMVKEPNGNSLMPLHADWCYVDETEYSSYAIWVSLIDTNEKNGCLCVIPYSQNLVSNIRGPRILQWNYPVNETLIKEMGLPLPVNAGEAIIYNHRLMHYSGANESNETRVAFNISVVPGNVPIIHYAIPEGEAEILKFAVSGSDFYLEYDNFKTPDEQNVLARLDVAQVSPIDGDVKNFIDRYKGNKAKGVRRIVADFWANFFEG